MKRSMKPLTAQQVLELQKDPKVFVLDCRQAEEYIRKHVQGSIYVPMEAQFAIWTAFLVDPKKGEKIVLVAEPGKEQQAITRLARTGLDCVIGYLEGGYASWAKAQLPTASVDVLTYKTAEDFEEEVRDSRIIDVRNLGEWNEGVLPQAEL